MRKVAREEILSLEEYARQRDAVRRSALEAKELRRVHLGSYLTFLFENAETVRYQVQEMLRVEGRRAEADVRHELDTYNELIGGDGELGCTLLIEIDDPAERAAKLSTWHGLPERVYLALPDGRRVRARMDQRQEDDRRISAVHYLKFDTGGAVPVAAGLDYPGLEGEVRLDERQQAALRDDLLDDR